MKKNSLPPGTAQSWKRSLLLSGVFCLNVLSGPGAHADTQSHTKRFQGQDVHSYKRADFIKVLVKGQPEKEMAYLTGILNQKLQGYDLRTNQEDVLGENQSVNALINITGNPATRGQRLDSAQVMQWMDELAADGILLAASASSASVLGGNALTESARRNAWIQTKADGMTNTAGTIGIHAYDNQMLAITMHAIAHKVMQLNNLYHTNQAQAGAFGIMAPITSYADFLGILTARHSNLLNLTQAVQNACINIDNTAVTNGSGETQLSEQVARRYRYCYGLEQKMGLFVSAELMGLANGILKRSIDPTNPETYYQLWAQQWPPYNDSDSALYVNFLKDLTEWVPA